MNLSTLSVLLHQQYGWYVRKAADGIYLLDGTGRLEWFATIHEARQFLKTLKGE